MESSNEDRVLSKKDLKLRAQEMKLEEKQRKLEEKAAIREEKQRRKNSFPRKIRNFFLSIIIIAILLLVGFYFAQKFLSKKENELHEERMKQEYQAALALVDDKKYQDAIKQLKSIDEGYSKYSEVESKLKEVDQLYLNEYLTEADNYLKDGKYEKALDVLNNIEDEYKNEKIVEDKRNTILAEELKDEVDEMAEKKATLKVLEYLSKYDTNDVEILEDTVEDLIEKYKSGFILETRELLNTDLSKAKTNIDSALKILPKDKDIQSLEKELEQAQQAEKERTAENAEKTKENEKTKEDEKNEKEVQKETSDQKDKE